MDKRDAGEMNRKAIKDFTNGLNLIDACEVVSLLIKRFMFVGFNPDTRLLFGVKYAHINGDAIQITLEG